MADIEKIKADYPWVRTPLIVGAPMRLIALAELAVEISAAGGIGFIGAGTDVHDLGIHLQHAETLLSRVSPPLPTKKFIMPIGIGFITWGASLPDSIALIRKYKPAAVWFFAPVSIYELREWTKWSREASPETKIWVQIGSVKEAVDVVQAVEPDVLIAQGTDAGGHGRAQGAGIVSLIPEVSDVIAAFTTKAKVQRPLIVAAGGIVEKRGVAAALVLGASGVVLGTRLLAAKEAKIGKGYQNEILRASDGGQTTVRTKVYDMLRGTTGWANTHNARGIINRSYNDSIAGMDENENRRLYTKEMEKGDEGWGVDGRMTTYAGTAVGLIKEVKKAAEITQEVREGARGLLDEVVAKL